ncbi:hypothetical protein CJ030_MR8G017926 [Morella rubra]|uniref:Uncharacterized protein n=1 Tax=Morella rubra TaxID=262757 RepID=A0A6A1UT73_9ROSI|nr:hypothetical protein CJ030_MR8G017926 [Morella rubra]
MAASTRGRASRATIRLLQDNLYAKTGCTRRKKRDSSKRHKMAVSRSGRKQKRCTYRWHTRRQGEAGQRQQRTLGGAKHGGVGQVLRKSQKRSKIGRAREIHARTRVGVHESSCANRMPPLGVRSGCRKERRATKEAVHTKDHWKGQDLTTKIKTKTKPEKRKGRRGRSSDSSPSQSKRREEACKRRERGTLERGRRLSL